MAQQRKGDDEEFWLPSEFLTDDDLLMDYRNECFWAQRRCGSNSDLSSPVESANGSTETDSDEEDYVSGLARNIRNTSLHSSDSSCAKARKLYGSPQSALSAYGFRNAAYPSEAKPPVGWDFLYKAAEEVARIKFVEEMASIQTRTFVPKPQKKAAPPLRDACPLPSFYRLKSQNDARLAYLQLQATQIQKIKQLQQQRVMLQREIWANQSPEFSFQHNSPPLPPAGVPETWATLQQSNERRRVNANVFLGGNTLVKKERNGTGVFLPRRSPTDAPAPTDTRRKPGRFLPPEKANPNPESDYSRIRVSSNPNPRSFPSAPNQDLRLPPEWSY